MRSYNQNGSVVSMVAIILLGLGLVAALGFGMWSFGQAKDYKDNYQKKTSADVSSALSAQRTELQKEFAKQAKSPVKTFKGPSTYGNITFDYPKTWSAYVDLVNSSKPIDAYFHPSEVPGIASKTAYALRVELLSTAYDQVVKQLSSGIKEGKVTASAFIPAKLKDTPNVQPGTRFDGLITQDITGSIVVIQARDKTLQISTQSVDFLNDFDNIVLSTLTFAP